MSDVERTYEPWQGFERTSLPEGLEVPSPQRASLVAKTLVAVFVHRRVRGKRSEIP